MMHLEYLLPCIFNITYLIFSLCNLILIPACKILENVTTVILLVCLFVFIDTQKDLSHLSPSKTSTQFPVFFSLPVSPCLTSSASWSALRCISSSSLRMSASSAMVVVGDVWAPGQGGQRWAWPRTLRRSRFEHVVRTLYMHADVCKQGKI